MDHFTLTDTYLESPLVVSVIILMWEVRMSPVVLTL